MAQKKKKKKKASAAAEPRQVRIEPVTNPELKEAINALKAEDPANRTLAGQQALLEALKKAKLLAPVNLGRELVPDENGHLPQVKTSEIRFYLINSNDGKVFFPAFTSAEEAAAFNLTGENGTKPVNIVRSINDYWTLLSQKDCTAIGVVVNPGTDNFVIPKPLAGVAAGKVQVQTRPAQQKQPANAPVSVIYTEPSVYPTRMVNAVYDHCAGVPEISRVWLKGKLAGGELAFALFVEADQENQAILDGITEAALPLAKEVPVETQFVNEKIMQEVIKEAVALYDRILEL